MGYYVIQWITSCKKNEYLRKLESFYQELGPRLVLDDTWVWPDSEKKFGCAKVQFSNDKQVKWQGFTEEKFMNKVPSHDSLAKFVGNSAVETLDCGQ